jgi:hypothetical protein
MLREEEWGGGGFEPVAFGSRGGGEEGLLEGKKILEGVLFLFSGLGVRSPGATKGDSELGGEGEPVGYRGTAQAVWEVAVEGDVEGEVVREGAGRGGGGREVGVVGGDRGGGGDGGVAGESEGEEDAIETRGPGVGGRRVGGDVMKSVGVLRRFEDGKFFFEGGPGGREGGRGEEGQRK